MDVEQVEREQNKTVEAVVKPLFEDLFVASEVLHQLPSNQEEAKTESILSPTYLQTSPNQLQILAGKNQPQKQTPSNHLNTKPIPKHVSNKKPFTPINATLNVSTATTTTSTPLTSQPTIGSQSKLKMDSISNESSRSRIILDNDERYKEKVSGCAGSPGSNLKKKKLAPTELKESIHNSIGNLFLKNNW